MSSLTELEARIRKLAQENEILIQQQRQREVQYTNELHWLRAELAKAQNGEEKISLAKLNFLADMSHELRTPLNTVIGFCQYLLGDKTLNSDHEEKIRLMLASSEDLWSLINDILDMAKIEIGELGLQISHFDLYEILESTSSNIHTKANARGLSFETEFANNLPQFLVGDSAKLRYILLTLLSNALKDTSNGLVILRVWQGEKPNPDTYNLFFEVEVTEANRELKFGNNRLSAASLGLNLSREFAALMGGSLEATQDENFVRHYLANLHIEIAPTIPEKPNTFLERVAYIADKRNRNGSLESRLSNIPSEMRAELHDALNQFSLSKVETVCQKIAKIDASLAQEIVAMAKEFDFKTILSLLSK